MTPTPRTDEQWQSITATSPWDAAAEQMMQHACELERELSELTEDVGKCHDVLGECRASDTSELWKFFETRKQISHRLRCREEELAELTKWREMIDGEVGTLREEIAAERALADRLADGLQDIAFGTVIKRAAGGCGQTQLWTATQMAQHSAEALAAWKEARSGTK